MELEQAREIEPREPVSVLHIKFPRAIGFVIYPVKIEHSAMGWLLRESVARYITASPYPAIAALSNQTYTFYSSLMGGKLGDVLYCASLPDPASVVVTLLLDTESPRVILGITLPFTYNCARCKVPCRTEQSIDSGSCIIHTGENGANLHNISDVVLQLPSLGYGNGRHYYCTPECKSGHWFRLGENESLVTQREIELYGY